MGCSTCKSNRGKEKAKKTKNVTFENVEAKTNTKNTNNKEERIDTKILGGLSELAPEGIFMKFIVFCSVLVAIPLFAIYLILYIFKMFFLTRGNSSGSISFVGLFRVLTYPKRKWKQIRSNIRERAREREFAKTIGYDDMSEIDVFVSDEVKEKREYTGELELEGVELLETTNKDNDNE
jgi:hypothetical protein